MEDERVGDRIFYVITVHDFDRGKGLALYPAAPYHQELFDADPRAALIDFAERYIGTSTWGPR